MARCVKCDCCGAVIEPKDNHVLEGYQMVQMAAGAGLSKKFVVDACPDCYGLVLEKLHIKED